MVDIAESSNLHENMSDPLAPSRSVISTMHCIAVSLSQGSAGLGTMWGQQLARQMLAEAGFRVLDVMRIPGDDGNYYLDSDSGVTWHVSQSCPLVEPS
jgi:hypothetical protein